MGDSSSGSGSSSQFGAANGASGDDGHGGTVINGTSGNAGNENDYMGMSWDQIEASLWGSAGLWDDYSDQGESLAAMISPQSLADASGYFRNVQVYLKSIADNLQAQAEAVAGENGSWKGDAASAFMDKMHTMAQSIHHQADRISGENSATGANVPDQLYQSANTLQWAREAVKYLDGYYAAWAKALGADVYHDIIMVHEKPQVVTAMNNQMRDVMGTLVTQYTHTYANVVPVGTPSGGGGNPTPSMPPNSIPPYPTPPPFPTPPAYSPPPGLSQPPGISQPPVSQPPGFSQPPGLSGPPTNGAPPPGNVPPPNAVPPPASIPPPGGTTPPGGTPPPATQSLTTPPPANVGGPNGDGAPPPADLGNGPGADTAPPPAALAPPPGTSGLPGFGTPPPANIGGPNGQQDEQNAPGGPGAGGGADTAPPPADIPPPTDSQLTPGAGTPPPADIAPPGSAPGSSGDQVPPPPMIPPMTPPQGAGGGGGEPPDSSGLLPPATDPWEDQNIPPADVPGLPPGGAAPGGSSNQNQNQAAPPPMIPPMTPPQGAGGGGGDASDSSGLLPPTPDPWQGTDIPPADVPELPPGGAVPGGSAGGQSALGTPPMMPPMSPPQGAGGGGGDASDSSGLLPPTPDPWQGTDIPPADVPELPAGGAMPGGGAADGQSALGTPPMMPPMSPPQGAGGGGGESSDSSGLLPPTQEPWQGLDPVTGDVPDAPLGTTPGSAAGAGLPPMMPPMAPPNGAGGGAEEKSDASALLPPVSEPWLSPDDAGAPEAPQGVQAGDGSETPIAVPPILPFIRVLPPATRAADRKRRPVDDVELPAGEGIPEQTGEPMLPAANHDRRDDPLPPIVPVFLPPDGEDEDEYRSKAGELLHEDAWAETPVEKPEHQDGVVPVVRRGDGPEDTSAWDEGDLPWWQSELDDPSTWGDLEWQAGDATTASADADVPVSPAYTTWQRSRVGTVPPVVEERDNPRRPRSGSDRVTEEDIAAADRRLERMRQGLDPYAEDEPEDDDDTEAQPRRSVDLLRGDDAAWEDRGGDATGVIG